METIDKYRKELEEDTQINMLNLRDSQMRLPGIKHKWASRLINHKMDLSKNKNLIIKAKETIIETQLKNSKITMSRPALEKNAEGHDTVIRLKNNVKDEEFVIMYLEKVEQILKSMTFDIKNLVEILKLEQL